MTKSVEQKAGELHLPELIFVCQSDSKKAYAKAMYNPETNEMTVLKGSKFTAFVSKNLITRKNESIRDYLIENGVLMKGKQGYELTKDYTFSNSSEASSVVLGGNSNGFHDWRVENTATKLGYLAKRYQKEQAVN